MNIGDKVVTRGIIKAFMDLGLDTVAIVGRLNAMTGLRRPYRGVWRESDVWNILARTDFVVDLPKAQA